MLIPVLAMIKTAAIHCFLSKMLHFMSTLCEPLLLQTSDWPPEKCTHLNKLIANVGENFLTCQLLHAFHQNRKKEEKKREVLRVLDSNNYVMTF